MTDIPLWAQIAITFLGGGLAGAFSPVFTAQLTYRQKKDENRLINARAHIEAVYLPINISLSHLAEKYAVYKSYKRSTEISKKMIAYAPNAKEREFLIQRNHEEIERLLKTRQDFILACSKYLDLMSEIANQGKDAFLTIKLEEHLRKFTTFIQTFMAVPTFQEDIDEFFDRKKKVFAEAFLSIAGSHDFTDRFERGIHDLKSYIKEVTLGE